VVEEKFGTEAYGTRGVDGGETEGRTSRLRPVTAIIVILIAINSINCDPKLFATIGNYYFPFNLVMCQLFLN